MKVDKFKRMRRKVKTRRQDRRRAKRAAKRRPKVEATRLRLQKRRMRERAVATWEKNSEIYDRLVEKGRELDLPATVRIVKACAESARKKRRKPGTYGHEISIEEVSV